MHELLLPRLKREIEARLAELRPLVAEAAHLEAAKHALLQDHLPSPARRTVTPPTRELPRRAAPMEPPRVRSTGSSSTRAAGPSSGAMGSGLRAAVPSAGAMIGTSGRSSASSPRTARNGEDANGTEAPTTVRDVIVALVEERPGVSVAEIASVTKIAKPTVATTVSKLKRDGVLADEAGGVKLASRRPLTLEQIAVKAAETRDDGVDDAEWDAAKPAS